MMERGLSAIEPKLALLQLPSALQGNGRKKTDSYYFCFGAARTLAMPDEQCPAAAPPKAGLKGDRHSLVLLFFPEIHLSMERTASKPAEAIFPWAYSRLVVRNSSKKQIYGLCSSSPSGISCGVPGKCILRSAGSARRRLAHWRG